MVHGSGGLRVGVDVVSVRDVAESVARFGARYVDRVYTPHEQACAVGEPDVRARALAARFAAKEATVKVLRPTDEALAWRSIEVRRAPGGWVELDLRDAAEDLARAAGLYDFAVSLSHDGDVATAVVVAHCSTDNRSSE